MEDCEDLVDTLTEYSHLFISDGRKRKYHEDKQGCHIIILTEKGITKHIECFDEAKGILSRLLGNKDVFCYDEFNGVKIGITLVYRFNKIKMVILTAFKKDVELVWPPKKPTRP